MGPSSPTRAARPGALMVAAVWAVGATSPVAAQTVDGEESPELRSLRLAEEQLFRGQQAVTGGAPEDGRPAATTPIVEGTPNEDWLAGLTLPDLPVRWDERVVNYLEYFRDDPRGQRLIRAWLPRLAVHGGPIRAALREHGLPEDLVFVAMIESGFDPGARSGAGAVGLWQFVSRTAGSYGLRQDRFIDERMDPRAATRAAAEHLRDLHRRLGRWELALAAYNMGYGALLRSIRKYNTNDYWLLSHLEAGLPFETTLYVAKIVACAIAGHNPEVFGVDPAAVRADGAPDTTVRVPAGTPLGLVARAARVSREDLLSANPAYLRGRTPPDGGPWAVRLPPGSVETFAQRWPRIARSRPATRPYVMRLGEDLAAVARRFRTTARALRNANGLDRDPGPGDTLLVPAVEPRPDEGPRGDDPVLVAVPEAGTTPSGSLRRFYRVRRGDTLSQIARFCDVGVDDLVTWNALDPHAFLQPGMFVQVFVPEDARLDVIVLLSDEAVRTLTLGSDEFFTVQEAQNGRRRFVYRVRAGDTLTSIGRRFGLRAVDLARINQRSVDSVLQLGESLVVYSEGGAQD